MSLQKLVFGGRWKREQNRRFLKRRVMCERLETRVLLAANYSYQGTVFGISDGYTGVAGIDVQDSSAITDVNVTVRINHSYVGDLTLFLESPTGTIVKLADQIGGNGSSFADTTFDDEASTSITAGVAPFSGSFRASSPLSGLDGENSYGTWLLKAQDASVGHSSDSWSIQGWSLSITSSNPLPVPQRSPDFPIVTIQSPANPNVTVRNGASADLGDREDTEDDFNSRVAIKNSRTEIVRVVGLEASGDFTTSVQYPDYSLGQDGTYYFYGIFKSYGYINRGPRQGGLSFVTVDDDVKEVREFNFRATLHSTVPPANTGTSTANESLGLLSSTKTHREGVVRFKGGQDSASNPFAVSSLVRLSFDVTGVTNLVTLDFTSSYVGDPEGDLLVELNNVPTTVKSNNGHTTITASLKAGHYEILLSVKDFRTSSTSGDATLNLTYELDGSAIQQNPNVKLEFTGNGNEIADGDRAPSADKGTDFGRVVMGADSPVREFKITNTGDGPLTLSSLLTTDPFEIAQGDLPSSPLEPGASTTFAVRLPADQIGTYSGILSFQTDVSGRETFDVQISGTVITPPAPEIRLMRSTTEVIDDQTQAVSFGTAFSEDPPTPVVFTVFNDGDLELSLSNLTVPPTYVILKALPSTIAPGSSGTFTVGVDSINYLGELPGQITFATNDADENPFSFPVRGSVVPRPVPGISVTAGAFGTIQSGQALNVPLADAIQGSASPTLVLSVTNSGTAPLTVSSISASGVLGVTPGVTLPVTLEVGGTLQLIVSASTATVGTYLNNVEIVSDAQNTPQFLVPFAVNIVAAPVPHLSVTGPGGAVGNGEAIAFPTVSVGDTNPTLAFVLVNFGTGTLHVLSLAVSGGFLLANTPTLPAAIAPGEFVDVVLELDAGSVGQSLGTFVITTDDPEQGTFNVGLSGTVTAPPPEPEIELSVGDSVLVASQPFTFDFGHLQTGDTSATVSVLVRNLGSADLLLGEVVPPAGFVIVDSLDRTISPGGSDLLSLRADTSVTGTFRGDLVVLSDDSDEPAFHVDLTSQVIARRAVVAVSVGGIDIASGGTVSFGQATPRDSEVIRTILFSNSGDGPLTLQAGGLPAGFRFIDEVPATIAVDGSQSVRIGLSTSLAATRSGSLVFQTNDPDQPSFTLSLTGLITAAQPNGLFVSAVTTTLLTKSPVLIAGQKAKQAVARVTLNNASGLIFKGPVTVTVTAVPANGGAVLSLGSVKQNVAVGNGLTKSLSINLIVPAAGASNTYTIVATVIASRVDALFASASDPASRRIEVPTVTFSSPAQTNQRLKIGGNGVLKFRLTNTGNVAFSGKATVEVVYFDSDTGEPLTYATFSGTGVSAKLGGVATVTLRFKLGSGGTRGTFRLGIRLQGEGALASIIQTGDAILAQLDATYI